MGNETTDLARELPPHLIVRPYEVAVVSAVTMLRLFGKRRRAWDSSIADAIALLRQHKLDDAEHLLTTLTRTSAFLGVHRPAALHYLAIIARLRGNVRKGKAIVRGLVSNRALMGSVWMASRVGDLYTELALLGALSGELDEATSTLAKAERHTSAARGRRLVPLRGTNILAKATIFAREERWDDCLELLATERRAARSRLRPHDARALALIEALCLSRPSAAYRSGVEIRPLEEALADARTGDPREFDYLGQEWPAIRAFLQPQDKVGQAKP